MQRYKKNIEKQCCLATLPLATSLRGEAFSNVQFTQMATQKDVRRLKMQHNEQKMARWEKTHTVKRLIFAS